MAKLNPSTTVIARRALTSEARVDIMTKIVAVWKYCKNLFATGCEYHFLAFLVNFDQFSFNFS